MRRRLIHISLLIISIFLCELIFRIFAKDIKVEGIRNELIGTSSLEYEMRLTTIPYLTYMPNPLFKINGEIEHNIDGYRGASLNLEKGLNELRILFLGGSTTYGYGVESYNNTYPHQVIKKLNNKFPKINFTYINGGIPYGTSAEILTHYLFKYKYYSPDLIIINTGGNDADAYEMENYQPDYNNWRTLPGYIPRASNILKCILTSKILSYIYIYISYPDLSKGGKLFHNNTETKSSWFNENLYNKFSYRYNAFYNNLSHLVQSAKMDSAKIVLLTFRGNVFLEEEIELEPYYKYHDTIMMDISKKFGCVYLDFPVEYIPQNRFVDNCHLDEEGEELKADYIIEKILPIISKMTSGL